MKLGRKVTLGLLSISLLAAYLIFFQVDATEHAIVTRFGQPVRVITEPGLYMKMPDPIQSLVRVNNQLHVYNLPQTEVLTADKKNIVIEAYAPWRVSDALTFLKTVKDPVGAESRLADLVASELAIALGKVELGRLVTTEAAQSMFSNTMAAAARGVASRTKPYGFDVTDLRLKQITFPESNLSSVFQRMKAERESIARQLRSEGTEQAARIRAQADSQKAQILADAERQAAEVRGQADAEAIGIYASAFGRDAEFYQFTRTLQSYERFLPGTTTFILPSDAELLRYLDPANIKTARAEGR